MKESARSDRAAGAYISVEDTTTSASRRQYIKLNAEGDKFRRIPGGEQTEPNEA